MNFGMAIDTTTCIGCHTCSVACKMSNNLPNEVWWNRVTTDGGESTDSVRGTYPHDLHMMYYPINCQHCGKPACVDVCPTGASFKRDDGIVSITSDDCIGCGSCITACPYNVRELHQNELQHSVDFAVGDFDSPTLIQGTVSKCTGCANRIDRDEIPACMDLCPGRSRYWGDLDDPESEINKFLEGKTTERLLEEAGTDPHVYFVK